MVTSSYGSSLSVSARATGSKCRRSVVATFWSPSPSAIATMEASTNPNRDPRIAGSTLRRARRPGAADPRQGSNRRRFRCRRPAGCAGLADGLADGRFPNHRRGKNKAVLLAVNELAGARVPVVTPIVVGVTRCPCRARRSCPLALASGPRLSKPGVAQHVVRARRGVGPSAGKGPCPWRSLPGLAGHVTAQRLSQISAIGRC